MDPLEILTSQSVHPALVEDVKAFRERHPVDEQAAGRVTCPAMPFYGKDILEMAVSALLQGENLLLSGHATRLSARPPVKMCWPKTSPGFLVALPIIFLSM